MELGKLSEATLSRYVMLMVTSVPLGMLPNLHSKISDLISVSSAVVLPSYSASS